ncbi:DNA-binding protein [Micrococcales bacterium 31B]|nr:DNA-binding protein [Micrococcales bacterium 31B]
MGCDVGHVRRLVDENRLLSLKWGERKIRSIPADFIQNGEPIPSLHGTATLLLDGGFSVEEAITWLFTEDDTLPGTPIGQLRSGQRGEVRRRAQALAF